jgi:signal peptidase I
MKVIGKVIYWVVLTVLIIIAGLTAVSALNMPGNYKLYTVLSGSMEPAIKTGGIVVVKPEKEYKKGDVISFRDPMSLKTTVTHRINKVSLQEGSYVTKGDANNSPDLSEVKKGNILGKVLFSIPFVGYAVEFMKTTNGLIVIVAIAAIIIYNELTNVKKELSRILADRKKRKLSLEEKIEEKLDEEIIKVEDEIGKVFKKKE